MIRRVVTLLCAVIIGSGSAGAPPVAAVGPSAISSTSDRVSAACTSVSTGRDVTIDLVNRTSIADELGLGPGTAFVLDALGLDGAYSQTATWTAGPGPRLECPPAGVNLSCVLVGDRGAVLIPGSVRAMLLAHAPAAPSETNVSVAPDAGSLAFDVTLVAIGIALNAGCAGGIAAASADEMTALVIELYPEAAGAGAALGRGDLRTAGTELIALSERAWSVITEHAVGSAIGLGLCAVATLVPGMLEVKIGIGVAKAAVPLTNLAAVVLRGAVPPVTVTVAYTADTAGAMPTYQGVFVPTGSMTLARASHTATTLLDGRVLIAGGWGANGPLASAELYDPRTGTFTATGSRTTARWRHTATLLGDGRVLIAGGATPDNYPLASAELYDPRSGTFSPTGSMATPRYGHTSTLLPDGGVLITGGGLVGPDNSPLASAELYDPRSGLFTSTGAMSIARYEATATLLADGRVLIAGGWSANNGPLASAELYDPRTGTFAQTGSMSTARTVHTATPLADGRVLVAGGSNGNSGLFASAELYDPRTGAFAPAGSMSTSRSVHSATLLPDGRVLVAGSWHSQNDMLASAELFDPRTGTFAPTGSMSTGRVSAVAVLLQDGRVLITGGEVLPSAELFR